MSKLHRYFTTARRRGFKSLPRAMAAVGASRLGARCPIAEAVCRLGVDSHSDLLRCSHTPQCAPTTSMVDTMCSGALGELLLCVSYLPGFFGHSGQPMLKTFDASVLNGRFSYQRTSGFGNVDY